MEAGRIHDEED
jgi:hypothetical protein